MASRLGRYSSFRKCFYPTASSAWRINTDITFFIALAASTYIIFIALAQTKKTNKRTSEVVTQTIITVLKTQTPRLLGSHPHPVNSIMEESSSALV
jgi:hypothetical protein